ncbi:MAG: acetylxylan esterase, partial [Planctomycetales bacterium]|nr:acetylxylan esterase [Planctomycetales bacterium]
MLRHAPLLLCLLLATVATAAERDVLPEELPDGPKTLMYRRFLLAQTTEALDRRTKEYEQIKTEEDARSYQQKMKDFFVERLGGFPQRTPLNPHSVARYERDGYIVEKVVFESRPNFHVTALLFLPPGKGPFPGVLVPCGHSGNGKAETKYQRASILMAQNGMAALCYDPLGQGERHQVRLDDGRTSPPNHTILGVSCIPLGTNFAQFRIWDGMRALDYLASRPEVDPDRLGCTGNSGGGTLTCYLMALDERIGCAAPSCYVTSMRSLLE